MVQCCDSTSRSYLLLLPPTLPSKLPGPRALLYQALSRPSTTWQSQNTKALRTSKVQQACPGGGAFVACAAGDGAAVLARTRMFYSVQILAKKGPLGIIWIAATLDKRLKRNQVFEANIDSSVGARVITTLPAAAARAPGARCGASTVAPGWSPRLHSRANC